MWELIRNNPIIKIVLVLIAGIIGFGILFNVLFGFGSGNNTMGHEGGGYGGINSTTSVLVYLYTVFFKLLIFAFVLSFIALVIRFVYKYTSGTSESLLKSPLADSYVKTSAVLGISVLALLIVTPILSSLFGITMYQNMGGYGGRMMNGYGYMNNQYGNNGFNLNELVVLVLKTFLILSVIGVLVGLVMFFLKNYSGLISNASIINKCSSCGNKVDKTVHYCPVCGQMQPAANQQQQPDAKVNAESSNNPAKPAKSNEKSKNSESEDKSKNSPESQGGIQPTK